MLSPPLIKVLNTHAQYYNIATDLNRQIVAPVNAIISLLGRWSSARSSASRRRSNPSPLLNSRPSCRVES